MSTPPSSKVCAWEWGSEQMSGQATITTIDYHTGGEPFRIVADPPVEIPGSTVAEKRMNAIGSEAVDGLRRLLVFEPRGHADMYGGFVTAPDDDGADFGVLFWHKDGFSTACGHGTIALGTWAVESGLVSASESGATDVVIDVPSGRVTATVHTGPDGEVTSVDFINVACRVIASGIDIDISCDDGPPTSAMGREESSSGRQSINVDLAWGGAIYACLDADRIGLTVVPENLNELISLGRRVKTALADHPMSQHRSDSRLSGVYGTIIVNRLGLGPGGELHQRNVTIFADGQVDRSPCGSGTAARIGLLHASGELATGQTLLHESIIGTRFRASVLAEVKDGVIPTIEASAHKVSTCRFVVDPRDELVPGFVLR
ncbi:proline racemase family protein [Brevibacterium zhoupengii]|uniref:proline racemase family protein n=1 Tax=Brevibacterium zhoupengii TaxID=2898795 RepID=UPI001E43C317|nr:proline racemase family protein [Brevibacterium zhoupengii]